MKSFIIILLGSLVGLSIHAQEEGEFTHVTKIWMIKASSVTDVRQTFLKEDDKFKVIGSGCDRLVIKSGNKQAQNLDDLYFFDPWWNGKPTSTLMKNSPYGECNDIINQDLTLLSKPIEKEKFDSIAKLFDPFSNKFDIFEYVEFGIPKGTYCNVISEEGNFWKIGLKVAKSTYIGYIPKLQKDEITLIQKCDRMDIKDIRDEFKAPSFPKKYLGRYEGNYSNFDAPYELIISMWDDWPMATVITKSASGDKTIYDKLICGYDPNSDTISFWGPQLRTEISISADGTFTGSSMSNECKGLRLE